MNKNVIVIALIAIGSLLTGYLLSGISWVGRTGIKLMYNEYSFLKSWWKGSLIVFITWLVIFIILISIGSRNNKTINMVGSVSILLAIAGLLFSYYDFNNTTTHKWLGSRFHFGVYLFWLGWIAITVYVLSTKIKASQQIVEAQQDSKL